MGHSIYKGKASLHVDPRAPEFVPLEVCCALTFRRSSWGFGSDCYFFFQRDVYAKSCSKCSQVQ